MSAHTPTRHLLIVWHSRTGASEQLARAALEGARGVLRELSACEQVELHIKTAAAATDIDLLAADAYVFCAPENLGSLSGAMKELFDRNYYAAPERLNGRPYGLLVAARSGGTGGVRHVERVCTGWRWRAAAPSRTANTGAQSAE